MRNKTSVIYSALSIALLAYSTAAAAATGLDRADEAAGEHGQQGRDNAREHQRGEDDRGVTTPIPESLEATINVVGHDSRVLGGGLPLVGGDGFPVIGGLLGGSGDLPIVGDVLGGGSLPVVGGLPIVGGVLGGDVAGVLALDGVLGGGRLPVAGDLLGGGLPVVGDVLGGVGGGVPVVGGLPVVGGVLGGVGL